MEKFDPSPNRGDPKETFFIGPTDNDRSHRNQWPSPELLPSWRAILESYHEKFRFLGIGGLQVCRDKFKQPQIWEDVCPVSGVFVVNIGDMMERWTDGLYQSIFHRVIRTEQDHYSMPFFMNPDPNTVVECLSSCCSKASSSRFPPIRSSDYVEEKFRST